MLRVVGTAGVAFCIFSGVALVFEFSKHGECNIGGHHKGTIDNDSTAYGAALSAIGGVGVIGLLLDSLPGSFLAGLALYLAIFAGCTGTCHDSSTLEDTRIPRYDVFAPSVFVAALVLSLRWISSVPPAGLSRGFAVCSAVCRLGGFLAWITAPTLPNAPYWQYEQALVALNEVSVYQNAYMYAVAVAGVVVAIFELGFLFDRHRFSNFVHMAGTLFTGVYLWGMATGNSVWKSQVSHEQNHLVWGAGISATSLVFDVMQLTTALRP